MIIGVNKLESRGHLGGCFLPILLCRMVIIQEKRKSIRVNKLKEITTPGRLKMLRTVVMGGSRGKRGVNKMKGPAPEVCPSG